MVLKISQNISQFLHWGSKGTALIHVLNLLFDSKEVVSVLRLAFRREGAITKSDGDIILLDLLAPFLFG